VNLNLGTNSDQHRGPLQHSSGNILKVNRDAIDDGLILCSERGVLGNLAVRCDSAPWTGLLTAVCGRKWRFGSCSIDPEYGVDRIGVRP
jgi:hypothetical protein